MSGTTDWERWHAPYDDLSSPLSQRLAVIQTHIGTWLDSQPPERDPVGQVVR